MKKTIALSLFLLLGLIFIKEGINSTSQPPTGRTNAPGESNCATSSCHNGAILSSPNFTVSVVGNPASYTTNTTYNMLVTMNISAPVRGFQVTALDDNNNFVGSFTLTNPSNTSLTNANGRQYVGHLNASSFSSWIFQWTAPSTYVGPVTFYATGNAANGNGNRSGDLIYATTFTFNPLVSQPTADFTVTTNSICPDASTIFSDASTDSITSWSWDFGTDANPATATGKGPHVVSYSSPGQKDVSLSVSGPGGSDSETKSNFVTVNTPEPVDAGPDVSICSGNSVQLTATSNATNFTWSPINGVSDPNIADPVFDPSSTTTYTVVATDANGCSDVDTVTINVQSPPSVSITASSDSICEGESSTLTASPGGLSYAWSPAGSLDDASIAAPTATPASTTTYTVIAGNNGCSDTSNITIDVQPALATSVTADTAICEGESVELTASGGSSYTWSPTTGLNNPNTAKTIASPTTNTTYNVLISDGNCSATESVTVAVQTVTGTLSATTTQVLDVGPDSIATLTASGGTSYTWWPADNLDNTTGVTVTVSFDAQLAADSIEYFVEIRDGNCVDTQSIVINFALTVGISTQDLSNDIAVYPNPSQGFVTISADLFANEQLTIRVMSLDGREVYATEMIATGNNMTLDLEAIQSGVYFLYMQSAKGQVFKKLLLE